VINYSRGLLKIQNNKLDSTTVFYTTFITNEKCKTSNGISISICIILGDRLNNSNIQVKYITQPTFNIFTPTDLCGMFQVNTWTIPL